jgi:putrescine transport system substrate-binding protein
MPSENLLILEMIALKKRLLTLCTSLCLSGALYASDDNQVNFMNWAIWIDPSVVTNFQNQTGITLNQSYFADEDFLKTKLLEKNNGLDLVVPTLRDLQLEKQAGLFQPIDKSRLPNYKNVDPKLLALTAKVDPGNQYGLIYDWSTIGIGYNVDMVRKVLGPDAKMDDWNYVLDPKYLSKLQRCGVSYYDTSLIIYGVTLFYLGMNPNTRNINDYIKATDYLMSIRKYLTYFSNSNYIYDLASGNLCVVIGDSGDVLRAQNFANQAGKNIHIKYVIPKSGAPIEFDMIAIPKDAPHLNATYTFLNALLDPKNAGLTANYIFAPNEIPASKPYLNQILSDPNATPTGAIMQKLFPITAPPPDLNQEISNLWLNVRYGIKEQ